MGWESFDVVRFVLGPLVQGQTTMPKLKSAYIQLIIASTGLGCKTHFKQHIFAPRREIIPLQWSCFEYAAVTFRQIREVT